MTSFKARKTMLCRSTFGEIDKNGSIYQLNSSERPFWSFQAPLALNCIGKGSLHAREVKACERWFGETVSGLG
jgi:hypothetical protein